VAPKHVSDSLVGDVVAEVGEGTGNPLIASAGVLLGHADDQRFDLRGDSRPSRIGAMFGTIELSGNQATVPAEDRIWLGDTSDLGEELPPEALADFSECPPLGIEEPEVGGQVRAQDPILCNEVFALKE